MRYSLSILDEDFCTLKKVLASADRKERAGYLLCGRSTTSDEIRLLVREVVPVAPEHYLRQEAYGLSIDSASYAWASKVAIARSASVLFVHSHPEGPDSHSTQDDREEPKLMDFLASRMPERVHGTLVLGHGEQLCGRLWVEDSWKQIGRMRVIGHRWSFLDAFDADSASCDVFERQILAFGRPMQDLLRRLSVGVVGVGGTGSAVVEQLARLGVGRLMLFDGDTLDRSNVSRVYGSATADIGKLKVAIAKDHVARIGLGTTVHTVEEYITIEKAARELRACDIVFCCVDNRHTPRGILTQLSMRYLIPVVDLGAYIDSRDDAIRGIYGRVTVLQPGEACLFCRRRINAEQIAAESLDVPRRRALAGEGYAPELDAPDPAVIALTSAVAAEGALEFMNRLSGFRGEFGQQTERIVQVHTGEMRGNRQPPDPGCFCSDRENWGVGDSERFLGLGWS